MNNRIFQPVNVMPFGINEGYELSLVYKYVPEYLEWLMIKKEFKINVEAFYILPNPTPIDFGFIKQNFMSSERKQLYIQERVHRQLNGISLKGIYEDLERIFWSKYEIDKFYPSVRTAIKLVELTKVILPGVVFRFSDLAIECNSRSHSQNELPQYSFKEGNDTSYEKYGGYNDWDDDAIDSAFEGDPEATWGHD